MLEATDELPLTDAVMHREGEFPYAFLPRELVGARIRRNRDGAVGRIDSYIEDFAEIIVDVGGMRRRVGIGNFPETDCYTILLGDPIKEDASEGTEFELDATEGATGKEGAEEYANEVKGILLSAGYESVEMLSPIYPKRKFAEWYDAPICRALLDGYFVEAYPVGEISMEDSDGNRYSSMEELERDCGVIDDDSFLRFIDSERTRGNDDLITFCDSYLEVRLYKAGDENLPGHREYEYLAEYPGFGETATTLNELWGRDGCMTTRIDGIREIIDEIKGMRAINEDSDSPEFDFDVGEADAESIGTLVDYLNGFLGDPIELGDDTYFIRNLPTEGRKELTCVATPTPEGVLNILWPAWDGETVEDGMRMEEDAIAEIEAGRRPDLSRASGERRAFGNVKSAINAMSRRYGLESYAEYSLLLNEI